MSIIPIFIPHAGCPHQCVFCNQKKISGQKTASAQAVRQQIEKYLQWIKPGPNNEAAFYGGSFTGLEPELQEELFAPVDELLQKGVIGSVRCSTRPDYISPARLEFLKRHNVSTVELGVQSLDDKVLQRAERGHDAASRCSFCASTALRWVCSLCAVCRGRAGKVFCRRWRRALRCSRI